MVGKYREPYFIPYGDTAWENGLKMYKGKMMARKEIRKRLQKDYHQKFYIRVNNT